MMTTDNTLATVLIRLGNLEVDVKELETRFNLYTPEQVNNLRLQSIQDAVTRISVDISELKSAHKELSVKIEQQQDDHNKTQIRVLISAVSAVVTILSGVLIGYITHFFH